MALVAKPKANANDDENVLRIRMYRVGFGDFFLMTVPAESGPQYIVIDCGVTKGKTGKGDIGTIKAAVAHMAEVTKKKLALVIVTHRHQDHIIGFSRAADVWKDFQIGEVWMSFWETEYDPNEKKEKKPAHAMAMDFQSQLTSVATAMQQHLALYGSDEDDLDEVHAMLENATGFDTMDFAAAATGGPPKKPGTGGGTNAASLEFLKSHNVQYYAKGDKPKLPKALKDAGLTAEILGPPPDDAADFMKLMDLAKNVGQYLGEDGGGSGMHFQPFGKSAEARKGSADYPQAAFREFKRPGVKSPVKALEETIQSARPQLFFTAAKSLDAFLNNQSLVVLFTFKGKKLLFAGDAQGGNWEYWMFGGTPTKKPVVDDIVKESRAILSGLDFYKMGHHGSTNATPIAAVDVMKANVAMCSTQAGSFGSAENNSEVPRIPLLDALGKKVPIVRSDGYAVTLSGTNVDPVDGASGKLPKVKSGRLAKGPIYVDYFPEEE